MHLLGKRKILYLYETPDEFYLQPVEQPNEALIIDRQTFVISLASDFSISQLPANATSCLIYGIIGVKHLVSSPYLLVITEATQIGHLAGKAVYRLDHARIIPFDNVGVERAHESERRWNQIYLSMLESVLKTPHFYFSYEYDLTNSMQRNSEQSHYDQRFLWNGHLARDLQQYESYYLPLIHGFVSINRLEPMVVTGSHWTLISRRSVHRAGTRFLCRGLDDDGNVANFVETEQILEANQDLTSFVQIRGSIPVKWSQKPDYRYKPAIRIEESDIGSLSRHFEELSKVYQKISVVSLIDKRGHEGNLEHVFSQLMGQVQQYPYHYFDFHKECSKMRWHRLDILLDRIENEIREYGFFVSLNGSILQHQSGVIRSNCIDSLDRTNVVQSMIASRVLQNQESHLRESIPNFMELDRNVFKNVWADNADILSIQYAGTRALKTDFTRTGKRTWLGQARDGLNSVTRYLTNNFQDDYRQDAIDLFLGNYQGHPSPIYRPLDLATSPTYFVVLVLMTFFVLYLYNRH